MPADLSLDQERFDRLMDRVADALEHHPMLLGYKPADRLLIAGALAIAAVRAVLAALTEETDR